jgi:hypothetical protein
LSFGAGALSAYFEIGICGMPLSGVAPIVIGSDTDGLAGATHEEQRKDDDSHVKPPDTIKPSVQE